MVSHSEKVMFEIYRDAAPDGAYHAVYFTELDHHNREAEISRALHGRHVFDGFIRFDLRSQAKKTINEILERLNDGEELMPADIERALKPYSPDP